MWIGRRGSRSKGPHILRPFPIRDAWDAWCLFGQFGGPKYGNMALRRGNLSRDIEKKVIAGDLPVDDVLDLDAIGAKVDEAMQFVGNLADALAVANVGKVGVVVQVAHDYGTGPHGEAMTLIEI